MVAVSSPPQIKVPQSLQKDREARKYFENLNFWLFKLWKRTGGGFDIVEDSEQALVGLTSRVARNAAKINDFIKESNVIVFADTDITANAFETIICTNATPISVTLEINPIKGDIINIKRTDAQVTVIGTIDGVADKVINVKYWSMKLLYTGIEWVAV